MSTVCYAYKIKTTEFWPFTKKIREFYENTGIVKHVKEQLKIARENRDSKALTELWSTFNFLGDSSHIKAQLQVFMGEDDIYFRVLETGYYFINNHTEFPELTPVFYDDRSDVSEEDRALLPVVEWIDERIDAREYFLYPVMDSDIFGEVLFNV